MRYVKMRNEDTLKFKKIENVSRIILPFLYINLIAIFLSILALITLINNGSMLENQWPFVEKLNIKLYDTEITSALSNTMANKERLFISGFVLLFGALFIFIQVYAIKLAKQFRKHNVFTIESIKYAKLVAYAVTAFFLASPLIGSVINILLSNTFSLNFSSAFLSKLILIGVMWLCVWILEIGTALYSENEMTI